LKKGITLIAVLVGVLAVTSGAFAAKRYLITSSSQIKAGAVSLSDLSPAARKALRSVNGNGGAAGPQGPKGDAGSHGAQGAAGPQGTPGQAGAKGDKGDTGAAGDSYLHGAYYSVAYYDKGDTNGGAIATVACKAQSDTAISGIVPSFSSMVSPKRPPIRKAGTDDRTSSQARRPSGVAGSRRLKTMRRPSRAYTIRSRQK